MEFIAGRVTETIERMIALYRPDSLIVGTRGQRGMKVWGTSFGGMGSVSKYVYHTIDVFLHFFTLLLQIFFISLSCTCHSCASGGKSTQSGGKKAS